MEAPVSGVLQGFPAFGESGNDLEILVAGDQAFIDLCEMGVGGGFVERVGIQRFEVALVGVAQHLGRRGRHRKSDDRDGRRCKQGLTYRHLFHFPKGRADLRGKAAIASFTLGSESRRITFNFRSAGWRNSRPTLSCWGRAWSASAPRCTCRSAAAT